MVNYDEFLFCFFVILLKCLCINVLRVLFDFFFKFEVNKYGKVKNLFFFSVNILSLLCCFFFEIFLLESYDGNEYFKFSKM